MLNRDLLQSASACRQVLEIVAKILAKRLELWDEQGTFQVTSESFSAAKLWLWSRQGCQTPPGVELNLEELVLARSSRLLEQWNFLANVCLKNLTKLRLSTTIPAHVVRALLQHHPTLTMLDTVSATIIDDVPDSQAMHDYKGFNCRLTFLSGRPMLLVPILTGVTFKGLGWLELEPERGPSSVEAFFQHPPKHISRSHTDGMLQKVWLMWETFITGIDIVLWVTQLQGAAIDKIILFANTSNTFHRLTMQGKDKHMCSVTNSPTGQNTWQMESEGIEAWEFFLPWTIPVVRIPEDVRTKAKSWTGISCGYPFLMPFCLFSNYYHPDHDHYFSEWLSDLEALEDNDCASDDAEEAEDIDGLRAGFIDDDNHSTETASKPNFSHQSNDFTDDFTAEQLKEYAAVITEHARKRRRFETDSSSGDLDSAELLWVVGSSGPLWRVRIKKHTQDHLVSRLKHYKTSDHCLIAAFALPLVSQWVYLDCQYVNPALRQLLSSSFAVATSNGAPILEEVPIEEEGSIRTMEQGKLNLQKGDWVMLSTGPYHNDVGCVREIYDWGAEILVIPHFYSHEYWHSPQQDRRQRSSFYLWDTNQMLQRLGTMRQICQLTWTQKRQNSEYDHGLLVLECKIPSLVTATTISASILGLFAESQHLDVLQAILCTPCPMEWHFQVGDVVEVMNNRSGVVCSVNTIGMAVDLDNGVGIHQFPFCHVIKRILVGDFILCLESGREGLVQVVEQFHIVALTKGPDKEIKEFQCPRNSVSRQSPHTQDYSEYAKAKIAPNASCIGKRVVVGAYGLTLRGKAGVVTDVVNEEGCPMAVVVLDDEPEMSRMFHPGDLTIEGRGEQLDIGETSTALEQIKGHPLRTKIGTVRDVICSQKNPSGLRLVIVLENYDPATTNKEHTVDYEHVLDIETKRPLRLYKPLLQSQSAFLPPMSFIQSRYEERMERISRTGDFIRNRAMTPPSTLNPAWDPRSKTPPLPNECSSASTSSLHQVSNECHGHWATDRRLLGHELRVKLNGKVKTLVLRQGKSSSLVECYIRKGKRKLEAVRPELAEAMHPTTPRNYERWIVIKVAVVAPVEGKVDEQTGEELHLKSMELCLEDESDFSKEINMLFS
ncbi:hypothetical protein IW261DRAFT_1423541 [Armillaria novae-zelandiae]|uniref:Uncharacterized protein n=1 Tax=Armillaria novae-zelandiae TaxID=153914 RepID=A0AA39NXN2_9AGAR|nr:hypothetical protein IW261DRAFT_1423541 [Armillaria novae-zelandiae]